MENNNDRPVVERQKGENAKERPIREYFEPPVQLHYDGIARPPLAANNFEIKPAPIHINQSK